MQRQLVLALTAATAFTLAGVLTFTFRGTALSAAAQGRCQGLPNEAALKELLIAAPSADGDAGGLFKGERMWGAIVNRNGELCTYATSTADPSQVWPGSQAIAKSKAYTANAFSLDTLALSTARLYTFTQPGHSLWSLGQSNLFDPTFLNPRGANDGRGDVPGGLIFFGGGVPLYSNGKI